MNPKYLTKLPGNEPCKQEPMEPSIPEPVPPAKQVMWAGRPLPLYKEASICVGSPEEFMGKYLGSSTGQIIVSTRSLQDVVKGGKCSFQSLVAAIEKWKILNRIKLESTTQRDDEDIPVVCGFDAEDPRGFDTENYLRRVELLVEDVCFDKGHIYTTTTYHNRLFCHRPRTHIFSILVAGATACFARWSRTGLRRSGSFNYVNNPQIIADFLQRFEKISEIGWGHDDTAIPATVQQRELLEGGVQGIIIQLADEARAAPRDLEQVCDPRYEPYCLTHVHAYAEDYGWQYRQYIVWKPTEMPTAFVGDGTRRYIAWGVQEERIVILTDTWRNPIEVWEKDIDDYLVRAHGVAHMPRILFADVVGHLDQGHDMSWKFIPRSEVKRDRVFTSPEWGRHMTHCRVVQEYTAPLTSVATELELMQALHDAIFAAEGAYSRGNAINQHVNIQLDLYGHGILDGWEVDSWESTQRCETMINACFWQFFDAATSLFEYAHRWKDLSSWKKWWVAPVESGQVLRRRRQTLQMIRDREINFAYQPLDTLIFEFAGEILQNYQLRSFRGVEAWKALEKEEFTWKSSEKCDGGEEREEYNWGTPSEILQLCVDGLRAAKENATPSANANHSGPHS